jgi:Protein of unknown function (DUF4238)
MVARRHHYVPRFYLKAFAVPRKRKSQTTVFDRVERKHFQTAIENVAAERDFNRVELDGVAPDAVESAMASVESELSPAIERIGSTGAFKDNDDRASLLNLIGLLHLRNPRLRETIRGFHERVAKMIMSIVVATPECWAYQVKKATEEGYIEPEANIDYETMKEFVGREEYTVDTCTEDHILREMEVFDKILPHLFGRGWVLVKAPKDSGGFVISDHPVCLTWSEPRKAPGINPPGLGLRGTEIVFPVSPQIAAIGAFELEDGPWEADAAMVASINGTIIAFAERQVYARDLHFRYFMEQSGQPRKASRLMLDGKFLRLRTAKQDAAEAASS